MVSIAEYKQLTSKKKRNQPEGRLQMAIGALLNGIYKPRLSPDLIFWTYSGAGEKKGKTGLWHYKKGLQKGDADYRFEIKRGNVQHNIYIETKAGYNGLTPEQKIFLEKHQNLTNVSHYVAQSAKEAIEILQKEKVII